MTNAVPIPQRSQSLGEEIANSVSHGIGFVAALVGMPFLLLAAIRRADTAILVGASVFAATVTLLYLVSTLYHGLRINTAKRVFRVLDHQAIFLLIAGTYTMFTLGILRGWLGWTLFGIVWSLAIGGIVLKVMGGLRYPVFFTCLYVSMGWLVLAAVYPLSVLVPKAALLWLLAGGVAYTAGIAFFAAKRIRYAHFIWHLFVLVGTVCHFFAVLSCVA
ncbi:MAG: hemolysin III family protein [Verrucomicrobia bacterium]|nr:hemolysin III family protein [Verrucomicrobiota bacterium]